MKDERRNHELPDVNPLPRWIRAEELFAAAKWRREADELEKYAPVAAAILRSRADDVDPERVSTNL